jgi:uncharacterized protein YbjT (DUF2867 family)
MKVIVLGASGKVGQLAVPAFTAAGHDVVGVIRRDEARAAVEAAGATAALVDLEGPIEPLTDVLAGADAVVWLAGANVATGHEHSDRVDRDANLRAIDAAKTAGVDRWIQVSSMFADRIDQAPPVLTHFLGNKALADQALADSDLNWSVVRAAGLTEDAPTGRITAMRKDMPYASLSRSNLASSIVSLVEHGTASRVAFDLGNGDTDIDAALAAL